MQVKALLFTICLTFYPLHVLMAENIIYPDDAKAIVDVTKAPYFADNSGKTDCTKVLIQAIDDIVKHDREALKETIRIIKESPDQVHRADNLSFTERQRLLRQNPKAVIGFERCSGTFPYRNAPSRILYFPNGVYLVSETISYTFRDLQNRSGMEFNRCIHIQGQSEKGVIIRLSDNAPGFDEGADKPVISFMLGTRSNVAMQNSCENVTIDVGSGNPGAVGLLFFANNTGAVRHVTVRSSDPERAGHSGLSINTFNSSCALIKHFTVEGFDYGIEVGQHRLYTVLEHITLKNQRIAGLHLTDHNLAVRGLKSHNAVPGVKMEGTQATLALLDGNLQRGDPCTPAIDMQGGFLFARNIETQGYRVALKNSGKNVVVGPRITEYVSHSCPNMFEGRKQRSLNLPVEETPDVPWEQNMGQWVSVNEFGARGDGLTDDTEAIQRTMNSGKSTVYFQPGSYLINRSVTVPAHVQRVNFMYCDLVAGEDLQNADGQGAFKITGESDEPVVIENLFAFELYFGAHYLIDHASRRTVVLSDLHTQVGAMYKNSVSGGKVFIENVCTTDQFEPYRNCFTFTGQQVWARQLNPERANPEVLNQGSRLWVLGFKTEKSGSAFCTTDGGYTEVLGGIFNISRSETSSPILDTYDASVSVFASTTDHRERPPAWNLRPFVQETQQGETRTLNWNQFPKRDSQLIVVPLYTGRGSPQGTAWPLKVSANGHYLTDQNNQPFLMTADTAWALNKKVNDSDTCRYLDRRKAQGFNTIMVYIQKEIGSPVSPNPTIFDGLKFIAKECLERDLLLALTPGWFGLNGVTLLPQFKAMTDSQLQTYGRFFAKQLAPYDNLIIIQGGDANPGKDGPVAQIKNIVAQICRGIREVKPDLLHVYHTTEPEQGSGIWSSSSLWFHDDDYLQLHGSQVHVPGRGYEDIYRLALKDYHRPHPKPHLQLEQGYEGQRFAWLVTPYYNRMGALWSVLHGGCAITYGHKNIWNFTQGWKEALDAPGALQVTYIASFLEQFPWWTLVPDDDHRIVTSGYGTWYNRGRSHEVYDYVTAAGAAERNLALAYVPTRRDVTVDMGWFQSAGSMVLVRWYDPTTPGTFVEIPGSPFPSRGQRTLSMPGPHADQESDYVLVMEAITQ